MWHLILSSICNQARHVLKTIFKCCCSVRDLQIVRNGTIYSNDLFIFIEQMTTADCRCRNC